MGNTDGVNDEKTKEDKEVVAQTLGYNFLDTNDKGEVISTCDKMFSKVTVVFDYEEARELMRILHKRYDTCTTLHFAMNFEQLIRNVFREVRGLKTGKL